jgi:ABC-type phosphate transport system auxiliary subunit
MESQTESTLFSDWVRSVEPWVWPVTAGIVVTGTLMLCTLLGMFWLVARPARQAPVVIWMPAPADVTSSVQPPSPRVQVVHSAKEENHVAAN